MISSNTDLPMKRIHENTMSKFVFKGVLTISDSPFEITVNSKNIELAEEYAKKCYPTFLIDYKAAVYCECDYPLVRNDGDSEYCGMCERDLL